eukprot:Partr_v1_DN25922_c0_g1_i2_m68773 putative mannosidase alpha class
MQKDSRMTMSPLNTTKSARMSDGGYQKDSKPPLKQKSGSWLSKERLLLLVIICYIVSIFHVSHNSPSAPSSLKESQQDGSILFDDQLEGSEPVKPSKFNPKVPVPPIVKQRIPVSDRIQLSGSKADTKNQAFIKNMMKHAWDSYVKYAWTKDELRPVAKSGRNWNNGRTLAATIIDSLDTLWIMGMSEEFNKARDYVLDELTFDIPASVSFFETTIRIFGGLLSAYELSGDDRFIAKAQDIADRLMPAFNTPTGIPNGVVHLQNGNSAFQSWSHGAILSEYGSVQLEFQYLSQLTNKKEYAEKAMHVMDFVAEKPKEIPGLYPTLLNNQDGTFHGGDYTVGALADSFYENLLKLWLVSGKTDTKFRKLYDESAHAIRRVLIRETEKGDWYLGSGNLEGVSDEMEHLTCFAGGMFALGAASNRHSLDFEEMFYTGSNLTQTCYKMYKMSAHGISAEKTKITTWQAVTRYYILRPEVIESIFYMWRLTHEQKYRDWGLEIAQSIERECRVEGGYSGLQDMSVTPPVRNDNQESFFLAETLKYLYLLFSEDSLIPLDEFVFNTEAHPIRVLGQRRKN